MIRHACLAVIAASVLGWSASAHAQGTFYVGPHMGFQSEPDASETDQLYGATARLKLLPFLGAEGMASYRQDEMFADAGWVRTWPIMVTGLLYPVPFLYGGAGAGWHHVTFDFSDAANDLGIEDATNENFGWHLAAGLEIPASSWLKLMADVRWVYLDSNPSDFPDVVSGDLPEDYRVISVGLLFGL